MALAEDRRVSALPGVLDRLDRGIAGLAAALTVSHWRAVAALVLLSFALFLPGIVSVQPMDRDEPRFAQATKQMLETGDFVDIRFQDDARHKKPVGIYWMQVATVSAGEALGVAQARRTIGLYRIPSFLGALAAVLLTYWTALPLLSRRGALMAGGLMAALVLLNVEARLAKTDAMLLATILACMGVLLRAWLAHASPQISPPVARGHALLFWIAMGVGILVKGPITPLIVGLAALALVARERAFGWLSTLRPVSGVAITALIVLPWLTAITIKSGGSFLADSLGDDMIAKVGQGQEKHWGPPGLYLLLFWATAWPAAVFVGHAFRFTWQERRDDAVAFLLAWVIPAWIMFEIVQTKLPHYVLPLYPALIILAIMAIERARVPYDWWPVRWSAWLMPLIPMLVLVGAFAVFWLLDGWFPILALPFLLAALGIALLGTRALLKARPGSAMALGIVSAVFLVVGAFPFGLPKLEAINLSPRLAAAVAAVPCEAPRLSTAGYNEPSLVFLTDTGIDLGDPKVAAESFRQPGCAIAFIDRRFEGAFHGALAGVTEQPRLLTRVQGFNINSGRRLDIGVYVRER